MSVSRVAIVGCGYFAQFHHDAWSRIEDAEVVAVCDRDEDKARAAAASHVDAEAFADVSEMLDRISPDLVDIVTPPETHAALITLCCARGIDAICQKPLAPSLEEAERIVEEAERAGITLVVHENFRFQPWYREIKRCLSEGQLGKLHAATFRLRPGDGQGPDAYLSRQPYFQTMPRFLMHETGIHFIDTFRMLFGEVYSVSAHLRRLNPAIAGEDAGHVVLSFDDGVTAMFDGNRLNDHSADNPRLTMGEMWVEGEHGVLRLDGDGGLHWKPHGGPEQPHPYDWDNIGFGGNCVEETNRAAIDAIRSGQAPINSGRDYLRNMQIVEAVYRSSEERRVIDLPLLHQTGKEG